MIEARGLTKRFGDKLAVDRLTFTVEPGRITGFLGPNGAGKTTTMRLILGLDRPAGGSVTVHGKQFSRLAYPMHEVGALPAASRSSSRATRCSRYGYEPLSPTSWSGYSTPPAVSPCRARTERSWCRACR